MSAESNLQILLKNMSPELDGKPYVFLTSPDFSAVESEESLMVYREKEGVTIITEEKNAKIFKKEYTGLWALITLKVHSDLNAVGFLAAITEKLAQAGISVNAISAYYHDHLFVPWDKKDLAMTVLETFK